MSGGDGGSEITRWQYVKKIGNGDFETVWSSICITGSDPACPTRTSHTVTGLTNGTAYEFKIRAANTVGSGPESAASDPVTPGDGSGRADESVRHTG